MSLSAKFLLVIASLTAGLLIVTISAFLMIRDVQQDTEAMSNHVLPAVETFDALEVNLHKNRSIVLELLHSHSADEVTGLLEEYKEATNSTSRLLDEVRLRFTRTESDRALYQDIIQARSKVVRERTAIIALVQAGRAANGLEKWQALDADIDVVEGLYREGRRRTQNTAHEVLLASRETLASSKNRAIALTLIAISVGLVLAVTVYRKIAKPIQDLSQELQVFQQSPDLNMRFEVRSMSELEVISRSLNMLMDWVRDNARQQEMQRDMISRMANHDNLTGLPLWRLGKDRLLMAMAQADRARQNFALMFLDLDGFKAVNDTHGHAAGDAVLKEVAQRLSQQLRHVDTVARIGGDEFVVILGPVADEAVARHIGGRIIAALTHPIHFQDQPLLVGVSIGMAIYPQHGKDADTLLKAADQAMYAVKRAGKNNFAFAMDPSDA
ncbi:diguanylate cyclase domain-containing protein [Roseateles koreensis]|uniref:Diguanylate cyclase n=1 Tax=Roseateles koreensis TaxID=2987526 RepID=A0ABT5KPT5_9BURK|nr:diguanylate cyclase [Roseateles koreensis]MDC8784938.1 diguanylate cyclase [Roseateles koreensis]